MTNITDKFLMEALRYIKQMEGKIDELIEKWEKEHDDDYNSITTQIEIAKFVKDLIDLKNRFIITKENNDRIN